MTVCASTSAPRATQPRDHSGNPSRTETEGGLLELRTRASSRAVVEHKASHRSVPLRTAVKRAVCPSVHGIGIGPAAAARHHGGAAVLRARYASYIVEVGRRSSAPASKQHSTVSGCPARVAHYPCVSAVRCASTAIGATVEPTSGAIRSPCFAAARICSSTPPRTRQPRPERQPRPTVEATDPSTPRRGSSTPTDFSPRHRKWRDSALKGV